MKSWRHRGERSKMNYNKDKTLQIYIGAGFSLGLIFGVASSFIPDLDTGLCAAIGMISGFLIATIFIHLRENTEKND